MTTVHSYEQDGCQVDIWADSDAENPNTWCGGEVELVTFDFRNCWLVSDPKHGMGITDKDDVQRYLPWTQDVPPQPGPEPEEPDPDDYEDDSRGQAEYDAHYAQWEDELQKHAEAVEAYEPYEEWEDQYIEGYRVFTVGAAVHSNVHLFFGHEIDYHDEDAFEAAYGFVVVRCAAFVTEETREEEFLRIAEERERPDFVKQVAEDHCAVMRDYVSGDVYGFTVTFPDGEEESVGGFFGAYDSADITASINEQIAGWQERRAALLASTTPDDRSERLRGIKAAEAQALIERGEEAVVLYLLAHQQA